MAVEKKWPAIPPVAFTQAGTKRGLVTVTSTAGFRVKMQVAVLHPTLPVQVLQVKRVVSPTQMYLGPVDGKIGERSDLTFYDNQSSVYADEQDRPAIPSGEIGRATFEEEPVVAQRTISVDQFGQPVSSANPMPVKITEGVINIQNAELNVQLSAKDNDPQAGDIHSSVRVGDGTYELKINPDGSLSTRTQSDPARPGTSILFSEALQVASGAETTLCTLNANPSLYPNGIRIGRIDVTGENIAAFKIKVDSQVIAIKRSGYLNLNQSFDFRGLGDAGYVLAPGHQLTVTVLQNRNSPANYECSVYSN